MKCFYHVSDLDGHASGAVVRHAFPDVELVGMDYGQRFDMSAVDGRHVVMCDFSLQPITLMQELKNRCAKLTWIDHHETAQRAAAAIGFLADEHVYVERFAACELAWMYFFPDRGMPPALRLLGRYDVWDHSDEEALPFQYGMRLQITDPANPESRELWDDVFSPQEQVQRFLIEDRCADGELCLEYERQRSAAYMQALAYDTTVAGHPSVVVNAGRVNSLAFESVYDPFRHDLMVAFVWAKGKWKVSLYSDKDSVDCGKLAQRAGGGGHKGAAGFTCEELPFTLKARGF